MTNDILITIVYSDGTIDPTMYCNCVDCKDDRILGKKIYTHRNCDIMKIEEMSEDGLTIWVE